jgi:hypothetical protein
MSNNVTFRLSLSSPLWPIYLYFVLSTLPAFACAISVTLDENNTESCTLLKGENIGKSLIVNFDVIGLSPESVMFSVKDASENEFLKKVDSCPSDGKFFLELKVNYKHDYLLCWRNFDSETKIVNFFYNQKDQVTVIDKSYVIRGC